MSKLRPLPRPSCERLDQGPDQRKDYEMPKYMLMMNTMRQGVDEGFALMSPEEIAAHIDFMHKVNADLTESGELADCQGLAWPDVAKIVKATGGKPQITDGPFPESKEFLAGYWIVAVDDEERAIEIAAHVSTAPGKDGIPMNIPIEVREVMAAPTTDI